MESKGWKSFRKTEQLSGGVIILSKKSMNIDQVHRNTDCPVTANMVKHSFQVWDNHGGKEWAQGNGTPLQHSCLENPMNKAAPWAAVHGVARSQTWLSDFPFTFHFHALEKEMATHSSVLAWRYQGRGSLVGSHLWGRTESDTTEAT